MDEIKITIDDFLDKLNADDVCNVASVSDLRDGVPLDREGLYFAEYINLADRSVIPTGGG
jgi:hypothetical protein